MITGFRHLWHAKTGITLVIVLVSATGCGGSPSGLQRGAIDPRGYGIRISESTHDKSTKQIRCKIDLTIPAGGRMPQTVFLTLLKGGRNYGSQSYSPQNPGPDAPNVIEMGIEEPSQKGKYQVRADAIFSYVEQQESPAGSGAGPGKLSEVKVSSPPVEVEVR